MKRTTTMLAGLGAAGALFLAGCGGSDAAAPATSATSAAQTSAASTSAAVSTPSSASSMESMATSMDMSSMDMSSMDMSSMDMSSQDMSSMEMSASATTTVGGDTTTLDAQSTTFFDTFCTGLAPLKQLSAAGDSLGNDPAAIGTLFGQIGDAMTATGTQLQSTPPPTFEGGDALAAQFVDTLSKVGPAFSQFGTQAAAVNPNDPAAGQQLLSGLESVFAEAQGLTAIDASEGVKKAVAAIPSCEGILDNS
ncbi:hypothetical protein JL107_07350 [Nakamurella flavida]|uniref:Uncharacterized protein n=1 Tax=Nakamurella flavida TaxID=363630 RepID=A0A939C5J3_9ACTN|nr:hypothetical protein [Nakamurella flavida]MBM9476252.1 hypothetical protein [Nakamurella flavida]MDP9779650.1 hypothetical protein [Nakamurella flavida]